MLRNFGVSKICLHIFVYIIIFLFYTIVQPAQ